MFFVLRLVYVTSIILLYQRLQRVQLYANFMQRLNRVVTTFVIYSDQPATAYNTAYDIYPARYARPKTPRPARARFMLQVRGYVMRMLSVPVTLCNTTGLRCACCLHAILYGCMRVAMAGYVRAGCRYVYARGATLPPPHTLSFYYIMYALSAHVVLACLCVALLALKAR